jgi:hypothetical protein
MTPQIKEFIENNKSKFKKGSALVETLGKLCVLSDYELKQNPNIEKVIYIF